MPRFKLWIRVLFLDQMKHIKCGVATDRGE